MANLSIDELSRQAREHGFYLQSITPADLDLELFGNCTTQDEVRGVLEANSGHVFEPSAIPSREQLEHRRQVKEELLRRGIDPTKPISGSLDPIPPVTGKIVFGGKAIIAKDIPLPAEDGAGRIPLFNQAGKEIGWADGSRVEDGRTICDLHFHDASAFLTIQAKPISVTAVSDVSPGDLIGGEPEGGFPTEERP